MVTHKLLPGKEITKALKEFKSWSEAKLQAAIERVREMKGDKIAQMFSQRLAKAPARPRASRNTEELPTDSWKPLLQNRVPIGYPLDARRKRKYDQLALRDRAVARRDFFSRTTNDDMQSQKLKRRKSKRCTHGSLRTLLQTIADCQQQIAVQEHVASNCGANMVLANLRTMQLSEADATVTDGCKACSQAIGERLPELQQGTA